MVILPHKTFSEDGFDYVLSYFDDPKTSFPSFCMNVLTSSNLPAFIETLHTAAAGLNQYQDRTLQVTHQGDSMCISARRKRMPLNSLTKSIKASITYFFMRDINQQ
ncbi:StAR- lipid transfer protein 7, mitochondrial [Desmophyllum pertusum]|uniref:StAR- lipid transfer protein 7, mitochondrial n=1 Tax=Desmophyllum pertusum TaxID=174260 RepID=A0A9W9ZE88_9CNID|nr:StAR- lipid transfer protein 7, mitochondrial [Desmophyllum pertusum]